MAYKDAAKHRMLDHLAGNAASGAAITHMSLHSGFPATDGNELSGGSYARQSVTFESAAGTEAAGSLDVTNQPEFSVPAGSTVAAVGFYTASSGGTLMADASVSSETFTNEGTYTVTDADLDLNA